MRKPILTALLAFSLPFTAHMTEYKISPEKHRELSIKMELRKKVDQELNYSVLSHIPVSSPLNITQINRISELFGPRKCHPVLRIPSFHSGIDFSAIIGTPVLAAANGTVVDVEYSNTHRGYGSKIMLKHDNEYVTLYAHLKDIYVSKGDAVMVGQEIGSVGNSSLSTGPHLHYEIRHNGQAIDPLSLYQINLEKEDAASSYLAILSDFESAIYSYS